MSAFTFPQTAVQQFPRTILQGQLADSQVGIDARIGWPTGDLDPGLAVVYDSSGLSAKSIKLPVASTDVTLHFQGFSMRKLMVEPRTPQFGVLFPCDVLRRGRIGVLASGDVVNDGPVFVVYTTNDPTNSPLGSIRGDAGGGGIVAVQAPGCKIEQGATAGTVAIVNANLP